MFSLPSRLRRGVIVAILMATAIPAGAQPKPKIPVPSLADSLKGEAKAEYDAAKVLYEANDLENALVKFRHAYELSNDHRLLWNMASCEKKLRHYHLAQVALSKYREALGDKLTAEDRENINALDETLAAFISTVPIEINEAGTTVFVDGENVGVSPLTEPLRVDVGKRVFRFEKPGYKTVTQEKTIVGNSTDKVVVALEKDLHEGKLIVEAGPKDAILLDGKTVGLGRFEGIVASGGHTLRVTAQGMTPFQSEVLIKDNDVRRIPVTLVHQVDMAKWGWIGAGAGVVLIGVIAGAFMYTPTNTTPNTTLGTFPTFFGGRR